MDPEDLKDQLDRLDKDANGNIICKPVLQMIIVPSFETAIFLAIEYADTPQEAQIRRGKRVQLILTREQSLILSERLTTLAKRTPDPPPDRPN